MDKTNQLKNTINEKSNIAMIMIKTDILEHKRPGNQCGSCPTTERQSRSCWRERTLQ